MPREYDSNSGNRFLSHAVLAAGHPKILAIDPIDRKSIETLPNGQACHFHPSSVNFGFQREPYVLLDPHVPPQTFPKLLSEYEQLRNELVVSVLGTTKPVTSEKAQEGYLWISTTPSLHRQRERDGRSGREVGV